MQGSGRMPRKYGYIAGILGALSGFYIWNEPLKRHAEETFSNKHLNKDISNVTK